MKRTVAIAMLIISPMFSCDEKDEVMTGPKEISLSAEQVEIIEGSNRFGLELFREILSKQEENKNVFISPLSVHLALSMTFNGAAGNTREQMMETLNYPDAEDGEINHAIMKLISDLLSVDKKVETDIANSIWYRDGFSIEKDFIDVNREFFGAEISPLDFENPQSRDIINNWVAERTNNRIEEIVDRIDPDHIMFLLNAIYFNGMWTREFVSEKTRERPFYISADETREVMTMETEGEFAYASRDGYRVAELPYGQGNYSMLVFLPDEDPGVEGLIEKLAVDEWNKLPDALGNKTLLNIRIPRFTFEFDTDLNSVLMNMGMTDAFNVIKADFTRINRNGDLYISRVRHKSFVEVNEEGTEAAAVTSVEIRLVSFDPDAPQVTWFHADRPFIFAIKEKYTNSIIFIGRVMEP